MMTRVQGGFPDSVSGFLGRASTLIVFLFTAILTVLALIRKVYIPQTWAELPVIGWHSMLSLVALLLSIVSCALLAFLLRHTQPSVLFAFTSALFAGGGLFLLSQYSGFPRGDAGEVFNAMEQFLQGDASSFIPGGYMHQYPHQIGLMYYYVIGHTLFGGYRWIYYGNLVWALIANWSIWQIVRNSQRASRFAEITAILLPLFFLPHLLYVLYGYNHGPSLAAASLGLAFLQRGIQTKSSLFLTLSVIALSVAVTIRQNFKILIIAILIGLFLELIRSFSLRRIPVVILFVLPMLVPSVFHSATEHRLNISIGQGIPAVTWVAFGLQDSRSDPINLDINRQRLPGWYNGYASRLWGESGFNTEVASEKAKQDLRKYASLRWNSPDFGLSFFLSKIESTWLEPTYQSLFFGALPGNNFFESATLNGMYEGRSPYGSLVALLRGVMLVILLGISGYQFLSLTRDGLSPDLIVWIVSTTFIGGFLFHLLWETKAAYVYPYMFMAIIPAALFYAQLVSFLPLSARQKASDINPDSAV